MLRKLFFAVFLLLGVSLSSYSFAAYTLVEGHIVDVNDLATMPLEEHYRLGVTAMNECDWREASEQFRIITLNFPNTTQGQDSFYYLGVSYFYLNELDFANEAFSGYLKAHSTPQYFEDAIAYKFTIANRFRCGAKKRLFGSSKLPKWASGQSLALEIYDEVIAAVPCHELAVQSMYIKAFMLWEKRAYREGIDVFLQLIRRFPKHELAPESYLAITCVYLDQAEREFQNQDLLDLANVAVRRFQVEYPGDERVCQAEYNYQKIKEVFATGLFETGKFYERIEKPCAAVLYYRKVLNQFPNTVVAQFCYYRLSLIDPYWESLPQPQPPTPSV